MVSTLKYDRINARIPAEDVLTDSLRYGGYSRSENGSDEGRSVQSLTSELNEFGLADKQEETSRNTKGQSKVSSGKDVIFETVKPLRIVSRKEWFAREPLNKLVALKLPAKRVIVAHTASARFFYTENVRLIRDFQDYHTEEKEWNDIDYNFLIGGDGSVYVGRGWNYKTEHFTIFNEGSISIAFIGKFCRETPPERSLIAAQQLIEEGVKLGKLVESYGLYGHGQLIPTLSPGKALQNIIKTWSHWSEDISPPDEDIDFFL